VTAAAPIPPPAAAPTGQWVHTAQYGWVWMPYGPAYSYAPVTGTAYTYVFYPTFGWRWVAAPWVWGAGPRPYFVHGPRYFAWYRPRFWSPGYRGWAVRVRPVPFRRYHRRW
jgi:hypothetical protein